MKKIAFVLFALLLILIATTHAQIASASSINCCYDNGVRLTCNPMPTQECSSFNGRVVSHCSECQEPEPSIQCCYDNYSNTGKKLTCNPMPTQECSSFNGRVVSHCSECRESVEPKVGCCKRQAGGGAACEEITAQACTEWGGTAYSSCQECWGIIEQHFDYSQISAPPAGYEDEVLVNIDAYNNPFPDTSVSNLSGKAAAELYRRAIIGGYPDGEFKGYRDVNRAEAAKFLLLARYGDVSDIQNSGRFPDVLDGQWYTKYVVTAADKGIISGHPDGTFRPADTVNTAEFLKMLSLTFGLQLNLQYSYADVSPQDWFAPYVGIAEMYDLFPERAAYLNPGDPLTREEVAVAIYQYLQNR